MDFFVLLALVVLAFPVIAIVALVKSIGAGDRIARLELRLRELESRLTAAPVAPPSLQPEAAPATPAPVATEPVPAAEPTPADEPPVEPTPVPEPELETAAAAAAADAAPEISFEERFGTRWVVWVGGVALALGGIFLVRYSIEAGLLGPKVRVFLGALFAAESMFHREPDMSKVALTALLRSLSAAGV